MNIKKLNTADITKGEEVLYRIDIFDNYSLFLFSLENIDFFLNKSMAH